MNTSKAKTIDTLSEEKCAELSRDVSCSVFFGFYDERKGYETFEFKNNGDIQGIYAFFEAITNSDDILEEYKYQCIQTKDNILKDDCEEFYWKHNPFLQLSFTNLINDFHHYLYQLGKKYNIVINNDFYSKLVPSVLDDISILCEFFMPPLIYSINGFIDKYIACINAVYEVKLLPTMPRIVKSEFYDYDLVWDEDLHYHQEWRSNEIYSKDKSGKTVLYAEQVKEYYNKGEIVKITTTLADDFGGEVIVRYRDPFI